MSESCHTPHHHNNSQHNAMLNSDNGFVLTIPALDCPSEERQIRALLDDFPIEQLQFMLAAHQLKVSASPTLRDAIEKRLNENGFIVTKEKPPTNGYARLGLAAALALSAELVHWFNGNAWIAALLALLAIALGGLRTYQLGWQALKNKTLNVNSLMTVAVTGAFIIGQWAEAAMVMVLFTLADMIEARTVDKARHSIAQLLSLTPPTALLWQDGTWVTTPVSHIAPGAIIRVAPGERIPLDGQITEGHSAINEAAFTGESVPIEKNAGSEVFAGTINVTGSITLQTTQKSSNTALAKMIAMVEDAQQQQAPIQRWIDQFAGVYTPVVFTLAIATALLLPLFTTQSWLEAIYAALVMLVIACPCALVLAAPVTVAAGLAHAAKEGIFIKGGAYLEQARKVSTVVFDKTGTLTEGQHVVVDVRAQEESQLSLGAALAQHSQHPVSQAIAKHFQAANMLSSFEEVSDHVGGGISGAYQQQRFFLGNWPWLQSQVALTPEDEQYWLQQVAEFEQQGYSVSLFASNSHILALYALEDKIRPTAQASLAHLQQQHIKLAMLTGDNAHSAHLIANAVGIPTVYSRLSPAQKTQYIEQQQAQDEYVMMVGDGINDGLALVKANLGVSLGQAGTDVAREAADVTLMDNSLAKLPYLLSLSHRTHALVVQNITVAVGIKVIILMLALFGLSNLWMAVLADVGVSLLVVANGLRALHLPKAEARLLEQLKQ